MKIAIICLMAGSGIVSLYHASREWKLGNRKEVTKNILQVIISVIVIILTKMYL